MQEIKLLSSESIPQDKLLAFLFRLGVKRSDSPHRIWDYYLGDKGVVVWIDFSNLENYPDPEIDPLIEQKLGKPPQAKFVFHISSNEESVPLALGLAIQLAERWPFVVDNLSGLARRIFTLEDLRKLQNEKLGFWEDEKDVPIPEEWYSSDEEYIAPWQEEETRKQAEEEE